MRLHLKKIWAVIRKKPSLETDVVRDLKFV